MNAKRFKVIFSKRRNALIVVGENASSVTKAQGTSEASNTSKVGLQSFVGALSSIFLAVNSAYAAPTGGEFAAGAGAIATAGALTTIHQTTQQAIVNWQSFSSASHETIQFVQPNANAAILNRVIGNLPSQLNGTLIGNGHVYLINQNGIMLGKDGIINVHGSFVGSTRDVNNEAFMQGGALVFKGESVGDIQILGKVKSEQGDIVLIANKVDVKQGAELVAGEKVQLVAANEVQLSNGKITVKPSTTDAGQITVEGAIQAAQVQLLANNNNLGALAINTTGTIRATGTQTNPDGSVSIMAEGEGSNIKVSGTIEASNFDNAKQGGSIIIGRDAITDNLSKSTDVSGATLIANNGFVETSGDYLKTDGISVKAKDWLLDPTDINIVAVGTLTPDTPLTNVGGVSGTTTFQETAGINASEVLTGTIQTAINNGTNVTISTANSVVGAYGSGNITIVNKLDFANNSGRDAKLTLLAKNGITQNAGATIIQTAGSFNNKVDVVMTSEGLHGGNTAPSTSSKGITLQAAITTNGDVTLNGTTNNSGLASASNAIGVDIKSTATISAKKISITGKSESSFGIQSASVLNATGDLTLDGTSKNWVGVVTTGSVNGGGVLTIIGHKTSAAGYQGININSAVRGASVAITGDSVDHYGVNVNASGTVTSTTGDVTVIGTGTGASASNNAVGAQIQGAIIAKGKLTISGTKNGNTAGYQGANISANLTGNGIEVTGVSNSWDALQFNNNITVDSQSSTLTVTGNSTVAKGLFFTGTNTFNADNYSMKGTGANNYAIYFGGNSTFNSTSTVTPSLIEATRTTSGGDAIFNAGTLTLNSGAGKTSLQTSTGNVGGGIRINGGSTVYTSGDVTIGSKNSSNAYTFNQGSINALSGNLTLFGKSSDGTSAVFLQDSGGAGAKIVGTNGANITIDGTNTSTGMGVNLSVNNSANTISTNGASGGVAGLIFIKGESDTGSGIYQGPTTVTNFYGAINMKGTSNAGTGLGIYNNGGSITAKGGLTLEGTSVGSNGVLAYGVLTSQSGSVSVTGTSNTSTALNLQGNISAANNVNLNGTNNTASNPNAVVYMNKAVVAGNNVQINALGGNSSLTVTQDTGGAISAAGLELLGSKVVYNLTQSGNAVSALAANAKSLNYINNKALTIDTVNTLGITAVGDVRVKTTSGGIALAQNISTPFGTVNLDAAGAIARTAGTITANALNLKALTTIGALTSSNRIQTNVNSLSLDSGGSQFVTEADAVTVSARTTANNGSTDIATTSGTLTVGTVNSIAGITTNGSGNVTLNGAATGANIGLYVTKAINAGGGIYIQGKSGTTHGVNVDNSALTANGPINITGTTGDAADLGVIIWKGSTITTNNSSAYADGTNAISIRGLTSTGNLGTGGRNVVINDATITNNSNNGNTYIYGQNSEIALDQKSVITNAASAGAIQIVADNNAKISASLGSGLIPTAKITQNSIKGVSITSNGAGNLDLANVINNGMGDVVVGAGILRAAGDGLGGQVKTNTDSKVTQNSTGKTYIYTGNATDTGILAAVGGFANGLFLSTIGTDTMNAASNTAYATSGTPNTIVGGAKAQVMFREKLALGGALNNATVTYGDSTDSAALKTALQAANLATGNLTVISTASNAGTFKILSADVIADMATGKPSVDTVLNVPTNKSTSGNLKASSAGYAIDIAGTNYNLTGITAKLMVDPREALVLADGKTVVFNNTQQTDSVTKRGFINGDNIVISGMGSGTQAGSYLSNLQVSGSDSSNYNVTYKNTVFNISAQTYVRPPNEATILSPVSFGLAFVGAASAAGGDGVDVSAACDAWSQRVGVGSLSVMTLLKPNAMGLRNAKTDTMDAMTGVQGAFAQAELGDSPCGSASLVAKQAGL
jgi:filamentous hemagglutinin family protein